MKIKKYKSIKPPIEAVLITKENIKEVHKWCESESGVGLQTFLIKTLEGDMLAEVGNYVIKGISGEFYVCKPDIFEKSYEEL